MKMTERNQMYETKFSQSLGLMPNKNKFFSSTKTSFNKISYKLPQLNRSFSSSTAKSAKQKLQTLEDRVQDLHKKTQNVRLQTRESRRFTNFLKEDLGERLLTDYNQKVKQKVNNLQKYSKLVRKTNEDRTQRLKDDCQKLNDSSIRIQDLMDNLLKRADQIEYTMGIYSGKEKHKL